MKSLSIALCLFFAFSSAASYSSEQIKTLHNNIVESFAKDFGRHNVDMLQNSLVAPQNDKLELAFTGKFTRAILEKKRFVAAFTGSSVTDAGDCAYNESYTHVYGELLSPLLQTLGTELEVRNVAQGNNPIVPYDLCVEALVGNDVDFVSWEQQLNCGSSACVEVFTRNALAIQSRPIVAVTEPGVNYRGAGKATRIVGNLVGYGRELLEHYGDQGLHVVSGTKTFVGKNGEADDKLSITHMISEGKRFGNAGWHPGPNGHKFLGYLLAYNHGNMLIKAVEYLEKVSSDSALKLSESLDAKAIPADMLGVGDHYRFSPSSSIPKSHCTTVYEPRYNPNFDMLKVVRNTEIEDLRTDISQDHGVKPNKWLLQVHPHLTGNNLRGSPNRKFAFQGNQESGPINFQIHQNVQGPLGICQPKFKPNGSMGFLQDQAVIKLDGNVVQPEVFDLFCLVVSDVPAGDHLITVEPKSGQRVMISHLLFT